ncbi:MAG: hypothetical protein U0640_13900 [Phycisphaerales bacterium]
MTREQHATRFATKLVIALSAFYALALTLIFWPGLATNDSGHRLCLAWSLIHGRDFGPVAMPESIFQQVFPPAMSLVAAALRWLTGTWGVMTFLGAWLFFASFGVLSIATLGRRVGLAIWLLLMITPPVWNHAIAMLPDAWVAAALCTMLTVFVRRSRQSDGARSECGEGVSTRRGGSRVVTWLVLIVSSLVFFTFRHNSITVLPLLLLLGVLWVLRWTPFDRAYDFARRRRGIGAIIAVMMLGVVVAQLLPHFASRVIGWRSADVSATIMSWEHVAMLKLAGERTHELVSRHSLDHVTANQPADATNLALQRFDWVAFNSIVYGEGAPLPARAIRDDGVAMREAFWKLVKAEPWLYAKAKVRIWASVMGLRHDGPLIGITSNPPRWTEKYRVDLSQTHPIVDASSIPDRIDRVMRASMWLWMPYTWFGVGFVSLIVAACRRSTRSSSLLPAVALFLAAAMYYAGFLIVSPGFEWRYFLPSFVLLVICTAISWQRIVTR